MFKQVFKGAVCKIKVRSLNIDALGRCPAWPTNPKRQYLTPREWGSISYTFKTIQIQSRMRIHQWEPAVEYLQKDTTEHNPICVCSDSEWLRGQKILTFQVWIILPKSLIYLLSSALTVRQQRRHIWEGTSNFHKERSLALQTVRWFCHLVVDLSWYQCPTWLLSFNFSVVLMGI